MTHIRTKGDLLIYTDHYLSGVGYDVYCKLVYIQDEFENKHDQMSITTGSGDINTKAFFFVKPLCDSKLNELKYLYNSPNKDGLIKLETHGVHFKDIDYEISKLEKDINFIHTKINFLKKNHNLEFKLKYILD